MKTTLIIGGNGYIGSRLFFDLEKINSIESIDHCWFGKDLGNSEQKDYNKLTQNYLSKFDSIILLAGHSSVKMCDGEISSSWANNVNNFISLVKKIDKHQTLIYASSGSVYGNKNTVAQEDLPFEFNPINNYDVTKHVLDLHAQNFINQGYQIVGLRLGTVNGWSPNIRDDLMINSMIKRSIKCNSISITNKHISRPILGITDLSSAVAKIISAPKAGIYNMSSFSATVDQISLKVARSLSSKLIYDEDVPNAYDFIMDVKKFSETYDFRFQSTIDTIIDEIVNNIDSVTFSDRSSYKSYESIV